MTTFIIKTCKKDPIFRNMTKLRVHVLRNIIKVENEIILQRTAILMNSGAPRTDTPIKKIKEDIIPKIPATITERAR